MCDVDDDDDAVDAIEMLVKPVKLNQISQMYYSVIKQNTIMKINRVWLFGFLVILVVAPVILFWADIDCEGF